MRPVESAQGTSPQSGRGLSSSEEINIVIPEKKLDLAPSSDYDTYQNLQKEATAFIQLGEKSPHIFFNKMANGGAGNHSDKYRILVLAGDVPLSCRKRGVIDVILKPDVAVNEAPQNVEEPAEDQEEEMYLGSVYQPVSEEPQLYTVNCIRRREDVFNHFFKFRNQLVLNARNKFNLLKNNK